MNATETEARRWIESKGINRANWVHELAGMNSLARLCVDYHREHLQETLLELVRDLEGLRATSQGTSGPIPTHEDMLNKIESTIRVYLPGKKD